MLEIRTGIPQGSILGPLFPVFALAILLKQAQYLITLCTQMTLHCTAIWKTL